ncbi:glycosyltransferase family 4 protein [Candidatus Pelagisphaera phototrophica]|uniref:glycosyltransferase family 4 protein n=1 Tax=Candidatus Pelagisphaera phototrophica TaxID=2684113 RepID=UPI0019E173D3|nr:glycosyltransferase family 4 protein [Candidatus Pelagisphaera phototrophica]QXD31501.1 glycosyltransferase family 4 protein [Candidatus Pelagisphaera phototrophica]
MSIASSPPILLISHEFFPKRGGIATYSEEIARGAASNGREIEVWAPKSESIANHNFPFHVRQLDLKGSQDLLCQLKLAREWQRNRGAIRNSIVHLTDPGPILATRYIQYFRSLKPHRLVLTFHGSEIIRFAGKPFTKALINKIIKRCDRIHVLSRYSRSLLERYFPESIPKILVIPGALKSDFRVPEIKESNITGPLIILTVGRLHPRKGQADTIDALKRLPESTRQIIEFWVVGSGGKFRYGEELKHKAKEAGFRVKFFGDVSGEKLQELYAKADIFALNSVYFRKSVEGYGLVYLEAAAFGLPIVAHRVGGVSEAVSHMNNGILVKPHDQEALTEAFNRLVQDPALRENMGNHGRIWSQRFSWNQIANELYNDIVM